CTQGSRGLSLFFLRVRDEEGKLNNIQVQRLKDKLGTRQMATAELWLQGARAELISAESRGVVAISNMLNITRIHNITGAVASMRRQHRSLRAEGAAGQDKGTLQCSALSPVQVRGAFLLLMEIVHLLGLAETNLASEQEQLLLRLLIPVAKLHRKAGNDQPLVRGWQDKILCVTKSPAQHSGSLLETHSRENTAFPGSLQ
ncbi:hypothetical protein DV515_00011472, partial [Chloebia gouldiae]